jgi:cystathionine beta-lyase
VIDIRRVAELAHAAGALVCVDNSTMSPFLQRPLELGADIVLHSATKFLSGHSDVMAGAVVVRDTGLGNDLYLIQNGEGAVLSPMDSFLVLRGLKTLALRMRQQQANAESLAGFLAAHGRVTAVYFPYLAGGPGATVHRRQADGPGSVLSFQTGDAEFSRRLVEGLRIFNITVSFGGVNSTVSLPNYMSHASIPEHLRTQKEIPRDLVRLSVGIEAAVDLVRDLDEAMRGAGQ